MERAIANAQEERHLLGAPVLMVGLFPDLVAYRCINPGSVPPGLQGLLARPRAEGEQSLSRIGSGEPAEDEWVCQLDLKTSLSARIVIVDYSTGNSSSIKGTLDRIGSPSIIRHRSEKLLRQTR